MEGNENQTTAEKIDSRNVRRSVSRILLAFIAFIAVLSVIFALAAISKANREEKIGWITDIHAGGSGKRAINEWNVVYPVRFKEILPRVLDKMDDDGVDVVISTGDQVNAKNDKYADKLTKRIPSGIRMLWTQGNHDSDKSMKKLGVSRTYYSHEAKSFKIIIIDVEDDGDEMGTEQEEWLAGEIESSKLPIIIASHSSLADFSKSAVFPAYEGIEKIISGSGKVKYALSGHLHEEKEVVINGVTYRTARPLTIKSNIGSYYEISLGGGIISKKLTDEETAKK